jgi:hypothetical protein
VRWQGIKLGTVSDVLSDADGSHAVGLEVACEDGRHRFLALTACRLDASIEPASPLVLLEPAALEYYRARCLSLDGLLARRGETGDVVLCPDGSLTDGGRSYNGNGPADEGALSSPRTPS